MINDDKLLELLKEIRKIPELYIGKKSLERLYAFIGGYTHHENFKKNNLDDDWMKDFQKYIENRYRLNTTHNWASIIQFFSNTEEEAFNKFYEHLDNFLKEYK